MLRTANQLPFTVHAIVGNYMANTAFLIWFCPCLSFWWPTSFRLLNVNRDLNTAHVALGETTQIHRDFHFLINQTYT